MGRERFGVVAQAPETVYACSDDAGCSVGDGGGDTLEGLDVRVGGKNGGRVSRDEYLLRFA